jgi:hypothetical protein
VSEEPLAGFTVVKRGYRLACAPLGTRVPEAP